MQGKENTAEVMQRLIMPLYDQLQTMPEGTPGKNELTFIVMSMFRVSLRLRGDDQQEVSIDEAQAALQLVTMELLAQGTAASNELLATHRALATFKSELLEKKRDT